MMYLDPVQEESIIPNEKGILEKRGAGFHLCSDFAKKNLLYIPWSDDYLCTPDYSVNRKYLESYVLFYIKSGKMRIQYEGKAHEASTGDVVFLDLRKEHSYQALSELNVLQFMVNGGTVAAYFEYLNASNRPVFSGNSRISFLFSSLQSELASGTGDDHLISLLVSEIFCVLVQTKSQVVSETTKQAMDYMDSHFAEPLTLDEVADHAALSKYYFSRLFHRETGYSPMEYLNRVRLRHAMHRLTSTTKSVESIACDCGFSSSTVFIRAFKRETGGITPDRFRQYFSGTPMGLSRTN